MRLIFSNLPEGFIGPRQCCEFNANALQAITKLKTHQIKLILIKLAANFLLLHHQAWSAHPWTAGFNVKTPPLTVLTRSSWDKSSRLISLWSVKWCVKNVRCQGRRGWLNDARRSNIMTSHHYRRWILNFPYYFLWPLRWDVCVRGRCCVLLKSLSLTNVYKFFLFSSHIIIWSIKTH